ncbi:hypothetical protein HYPSUDRAFT_87915 [Hypholoma sublateritium FD-334 SS-4]|uniref:F-box domain-containing protein n=1 Tax=Hypholoma sublateritium (strain FD-334 SS-4) TaxID=945553 RepID=A0A0D2NSB5_HYPSF|nr:hypothetical protein HYPSUDRAFT_87915 [Hypholoma sublateritium FD-334 SS-4]
MDYRAQIVPYDILATIADQVAIAVPVTRREATLRALSQTCKFMVPVCRRHLFSSIRLHGSKVSYQNLMNLLEEKPEVASYVRTLWCTLRPLPNEHENGVLEALLRHSTSPGNSSSLHSISLDASFRTGDEWSVQPASMRRLLISLIQLPTIIGLHLSGIQDFPVNQLSLCRALRHLSLQDVRDFALLGDNSLPTDCRVPTPLLLGVSMTSYNSLVVLMDPKKGPNALGPIIDFSLLQEATFTVCKPVEVDHICRLLKTAQKLERLSIEVDDMSDAVRLEGLGAILATNAASTSTLKSIFLHSNVGYMNKTALWGLDCALQDLAGKNILEEIELCIKVCVEEGMHCTGSGDFPNLDRVLTEPGAFPKLRRVAIEFHWNFYKHENEAEEDEDPECFIPDKVTREQFVRLSSNVALDFSFCEDEHIAWLTYR